MPSSSFTIIFSITNRDSTFQLPNQFVTSGSDSVVLDSSRTLRRNVEYTINYRFGKISFDSSFVAALVADTSHMHSITLYYQYLPFKFRDSYFRRKLLVLKDSTGKDTLRISKPRASFGLDDIF
ncbi:MAG: hypothetical protein AAB209_09920 [Bacteroidota bacterium]